MSDITERLHAEAARHIGRGTTDEAYPTVQVLLLAAADEIDRLRALLRVAHRHCPAPLQADIAALLNEASRGDAEPSQP